MSYMTQLKNTKNPVFQNNEPYVTYGYMSKEYGSAHYGADLTAGKGSDYVVADEDGIIEYVKKSVEGFVMSPGDKNALGNNIKLRHSANDMSRYCHLEFDSITVKKGDIVRKGDILGYMGSTGYSFGAHVHFERWVNGSRVDPEPYLLGEMQYEVDSEYRYHPPLNAELYITFNTAYVYRSMSEKENSVGKLKKSKYFPVSAELMTENGEKWLKLAENGLFSPLRVLYLTYFRKLNISCRLYTVKSGVNVRQKPTVSSDKLGRLSKGDFIYCVEGSESKRNTTTWIKVIINNEYAYVNKRYLTAAKNQ